MRLGRTLVALVALGLLAVPEPGWAQSAQKILRVGFLAVAGPTPDGSAPAPLRESLRRLGYVEGTHIAYEARFADGRHDRLRLSRPSSCS